MYLRRLYGIFSFVSSDMTNNEKESESGADDIENVPKVKNKTVSVLSSGIL